ncbi:MAG: type II secretion system protein [Synergistaceae bacterium]|nr:type II secretion system protein [Synergistaceae bacterium]
MKKMRKGFTLVELLIVVAILATLAAAMTVSVMGSTAKAKAATIASNVDAFVKAAGQYCADNMDVTIGDSIKTDNVLGTYIGKWGDLKNGTSVKYEAVDIAKGTATQDKTWCVKVTISDADKDNIVAALEKIPGFGKYDAAGSSAVSVVSTGTFHVWLWNGQVSTAEPSNS